MTVRASIVGGSGYAGGELLRLLLGHPEFEVGQVTSRRLAGGFVHFTHPNLRGHTDLRYCTARRTRALRPALPLRAARQRGRRYRRLLRARPRGSSTCRPISGSARRRPTRTGTPLRTPRRSGSIASSTACRSSTATRSPAHPTRAAVGCNATATLLGLLPLLEPEPLERNLVDWRRGVVTELKVGSSEGGASASDASHHPERSGAVRSFRPTGHRHTAEVEQALARRGVDATGRVHLSVTSVEMVRGVLATSHLFLNQPDIGKPTERELFRAYRSFCRQQPFVRLVKERRGIYRYPEPKILAGSNHAEVGFELDPRTGRLVVICAIDNLMKGAAGNAVQCANLMCGFPPPPPPRNRGSGLPRPAPGVGSSSCPNRARPTLLPALARPPAPRWWSRPGAASRWTSTQSPPTSPSCRTPASGSSSCMAAPRRRTRSPSSWAIRRSS